MRLRQQQHKFACGLACVATVSDVPYKKVQADLSDIRGEPNFHYNSRTKSRCLDYGTSANDLHMLFKKNGIVSNKFWRKFKDWTSLPSVCILAVYFKKGRSGWHWVVYDRESDVVLNPTPTSKNVRTDYKRLRPKFYLKVHA